MPEPVCRISWRKGLPLGISVSPEVGFLDLPRELRDKVYHHSLSVSEPIEVWDGSLVEYEVTVRSPGEMTRKTTQTVRTYCDILGYMAFNLLMSNRQLRSEAAPVFYTQNVFRFSAQDNWSPLYAFLEMIGEENRNKLRRLEMSMFQPRYVYQYPDGTRTTLDTWRFREVIPQSSFARSFPATAVDQEPRTVEHLDPAIEACFRILGTRRATTDPGSGPG